MALHHCINSSCHFQGKHCLQSISNWLHSHAVFYRREMGSAATPTWKPQCLQGFNWSYLTFRCNIPVVFYRLNTKYITSSTWYFSDHASWIEYIWFTNLMPWLLVIHKILFSCTCFEPQVLIFRRIQLYTCSTWYCHSLWQREWQYHMLHVYNCILLKMSTSGLKHVEENNILWINNNQCIKLVNNI